MRARICNNFKYAIRNTYTRMQKGLHSLMPQLLQQLQNAETRIFSKRITVAKTQTVCIRNARGN